MARTPLTREALVKNFPSSYTSVALRTHFASEYLKVVGQHAEAVCIETLVKSFKNMWKVLKNKARVYSTPRGKEWLQIELPIKEPAPEMTELPVEETANTAPQQKPRKPFQALSARGKRYRIQSLCTRTPDTEEIDFLHSSIKKHKLDLSSAIDSD